SPGMARATSSSVAPHRSCQGRMEHRYPPNETAPRAANPILTFFPIAGSSFVLLCSADPCDSSQVPGDVCCPGIYGFPVAEVAFGSPNRLYHHPFSERQSLVVECSEKDPLFPGP